ncbi:FMN-linked oxidoreductase [Periconia macrospinosa]|uniref:FMN-linked oxidoreductase n=1 Tax=Periconia macrospinosa TaxID=97972 RepID=A0A2V1E1Y0_9PLEO|nr:FMN-linked oxidoreductase [Periconia macrospinosa]
MSSNKIIHLLQPTTIGTSIPLRNRICMASLTRNRCIDDNKPTEASVQHYATRAKDGTGLIISEGIFIYINGCDWLHSPMLFKPEHVEPWKKVTDAVHKEGGKIFCQTWHPGRSQNENIPMLKAANYPVLAPSSIPRASGRYHLLEGNHGHSRNVTEITDPKEIIEQYKNSVKLAKQAGFDGIEILAQGDYLLHNFLLSRSNQRTDKYGGSTENRCRFVLEVIDAILETWSPESVGIKVSPSDILGDTVSPYTETSETYSYLIKQVVARGLGYICLSRRGCIPDSQPGGIPVVRPPGTELPENYDILDDFGHLIKFPGSKTSLMVNSLYTADEAERLVRDDKIDLVAFGRPFIYNPDVVTRIKRGSPLATNERGGFVYYGPYNDISEGYNDWPFDSQNSQ